MGPDSPLLIKDIPEDSILFYDIETDHQYAPYAELRMVGAQVGLNSSPFLVKDYRQRKRFKEMLSDRDVLKVSFNGNNFDNLVLWRHGFPVNEINSHDMFLAAKTVAPALPAYSLKFINWYFFGDWHRPEFELHAWAKKHRCSTWDAPESMLGPYCLYDVNPQTLNTFLMLWEVVQRPLHWRAYTETELPMGMPLEEIMLRGGEYLDSSRIEQQLTSLENQKMYWEDIAWHATGGKVENPNSTKQVGQYLLDEEKIELEITEAGNFSIKKADLMEFLPDISDLSKDRNSLLRCTFEARRINNSLSYLRNYRTALQHCKDHTERGWIPKQYSSSSARTRRILSNSFYKLNFQNPNEYAKQVLVVPKGWLGFWIDATQIENVVHIYESQDEARRAAYEADEEWNEYVWLAQRLLGRTDVGKKELDDKTLFRSEVIPHWSIYKQVKTTKLGVNFGMGVAKFCLTSKLSATAGTIAFRDLHEACPAIRGLVTRVKKDLQNQGYVQDSFGHIYSGPVNKAYKVVAYLIQGCGTGNLPKRQIRLNYDTLHRFDQPANEVPAFNGASIVDTHRGIRSFGIMCGTTHDENSGRISLGCGPERLLVVLHDLMENMTSRLSPLFDGIPLRAKLALSVTTEAEQIKFDLKKDHDKLVKYLETVCNGSPQSQSKE